MDRGERGASRPARDWSAAELATLVELAETFVRGDALRRARLTADALERAADPAQVAQVRLVLRLFQSRPANLLLGAGWQPFRAMSAARRERYLLGWANSRIPLRRSAFQGLRKLLTFLAYADPGESGPNPRLIAMGYEPDDPPVAASSSPIRPVRPPFEAGSPDEPLVMDADAVIVGSGAGGGVVAAALAAAGRSVVVVEAGPFADEASMPTDELAAFDRLYLNHGLLTTWDGSVTMLAGTAVGGGTLVNWTTCLPAPDWIRDEWQRDHGIGGLLDESWAGDVAALEAELSVTPTSPIAAKDGAILRGAAALGWEAAPTSRNAAACDDCGSCPFGCRRGTKRSGVRVHLEAAGAAGARIVSRARVTRVLLDAAGRASGVEANALWTDPATNDPIAEAGGRPSARTRRLIVRAPVVVLAAGALRTPAVLQGSGFVHPAIGRHLRIHPVPIVAGIYVDPIDMWRGPMQGARSMEFARPGPGSNGYVIESAPGHPGLLALALPWEGTDAHHDVMLAGRRIGPLIAVTRDGGEGRTTLTRAGRVRVDYRLDAGGAATLRHAAVSMARLARAAGAVRIVAVGTPPLWHGRDGFTPGTEAAAFARFEAAIASLDVRPNHATIVSAHQMGTARMGADPRTHVCDSWGRVRVGDRADRVVGGLYIADGSLFPTGLGVNPMVTIMALARRVGRAVLDDGPVG